ncbi:hypothetical protein [Variovorax sp. YR752]|uniref:hypothetical protein n=1 Tax=Variovorax sp. YR752 TaxID=1884383 RepID=UPI003137C405
MNPILGWALAAVFVALAWQQYGWQGVLFAISVVVFWLLLQFSRTVRAMRQAGQAPVGHVDSAVMLNAKLRPGMTMLQVIGLTKSLGRKLEAGDDDWAWSDEGGSTVRLHFTHGKLARHELDRPAP